MSVDTPCVQHFRQNLAELMNALELSQSQLAERAEMTQANLSRILTAKAVPGLDMVGRLATALGVDVERLVRSHDRGPKKSFSKAS